MTAAESGARTEGERLLVRELRLRKITGWAANHRWDGCELDIAFIAEKVAIEIDGWAFHSDRDTGHRHMNPVQPAALSAAHCTQFSPPER